LSITGNADDVCTAVSSGVTIIQYRSKSLSTLEMIEEAFALKKISTGTLFIVNDRIDIALAVDADGVHIGKSDMPYAIARRILGSDKIIGVSVHELSEAIAAEAAGADYLGVGPIFSTFTKQDAEEPTGVNLIREIKAHVSIPIVAIGGINLLNAHEVVEAGADAICAISAVVGQSDPRSVIHQFQKMFSI